MITSVSRSELNRIKDKSLDDIAPEDLEAFELGDYESPESESGFSAKISLLTGSLPTKMVQGSYRMLSLPVQQFPAHSRSGAIMGLAQGIGPTMQEFVIAFPQNAFERVMPAAFAPLLWLSEALSLEKANRRDRALDIVFGEVDKLFRKGDFETCNRLLDLLDVEHLSINLLIGFLTITSAADEFLPARERFYSRVETRLANHPNKDKLLTGLKGSFLNAPRFF